MLVGIGGLLAVFALLAALAWHSSSRNKAALKWPSVEGDITKSTVNSKWTTDSQGHAVMHHRPIVTYSYAVNGQAFTGKRIAFFSKPIDTAAQAQTICDRFPAGAKVPVYYNPANPKDAVLERITPKK